MIKNAFSDHKGWDKVWHNPEPKKEYDAIIIGGGGHGLGAAYYLAKEHGITDVAVLEKGWLGGGNTARNTMTIRDNFVYPTNIIFHREAVKSWQGLSEELNYNLMLGRRGMITFLMSEADVSEAHRMANTVNVFGLDHRVISLRELKDRVPLFHSPSRKPVLGGIYHPKVYMARHDAVAWAYARAADALGVDIIQNCEVTGIIRQGDHVVGVHTNRGVIKAEKVGMAVAGHSSRVAQMAGLNLPVETWTLQAFVSTPVKPVLDEIMVLRGFNTYFMQTDKGELVMGSITDPYPSYAQGGTPSIPESIVANILEVFPQFTRMKFMRQWGGALDVTYDNSPIISKTDVQGFYIDVAGSGGFKTTPLAARMHADLIANDRPHPLIRDLGLERFDQGQLILERASYGNR